ncbi:uncharacterized protein TEOVI_000095100 [Trypanosoma equiperdum]|uniref:Uncharacterized protein n=2 Tax=Trypanozoon TaxID=39700 RepID=Q57VY2_TRYB2|nr:hypothetical protein, conserved [Trypanosoma brucei brucei TREU927]AAX70237.1 hypothetical protein, conserved [Trypanosoma brucei]AAZ13218.1 hypothetical protein, conserved [Trypanosoma brucei brucei TREU927]SCU69385.1 hypothetical protein, conserved [Trypanosoma equiperdum]
MMNDKMLGGLHWQDRTSLYRAPSTTIWALRSIALNSRAGGCAALQQLLVVAEEKRRQQLEPQPHRSDTSTEAFLQRLVEWPLPVLTRCSSILHATRGILCEWISEAARTVKTAAEAAPTIAYYRRLYNICIWQRRHPLFILTPVLDFLGCSSTCEAIDDVLEGLSLHLVPALSTVPHVLRCDVLMTFPRVPFEQQRHLMEALRRSHPTASDVGLAGGGSEKAPPPELFIGKFMQVVPQRFGKGDISEEQYTELRRAFELHKREGVRRILAHTP